MINYSAVEYLQANNMLALASSLTQTAFLTLLPPLVLICRFFSF